MEKNHFPQQVSLLTHSQDMVDIPWVFHGRFTLVESAKSESKRTKHEWEHVRNALINPGSGGCSIGKLQQITVSNSCQVANGIQHDQQLLRVTKFRGRALTIVVLFWGNSTKQHTRLTKPTQIVSWHSKLTLTLQITISYQCDFMSCLR